MDESEKRRERLRAMRMEASQAGPSTTAETSASHSDLSNPFGETYTNLPVQGDSLSAPRFGFYTDPMGAFSGNKKKNMYSRAPGGHYTPQSTAGSHFAHIPSPGNPERPHFQAAYSPNQMRHHAPNPFNAHGSYRGPLSTTSPSPSYQVIPPGPPTSYNFPSNASSHSNFPRPGFEQVDGPRFTPDQGGGQWFNRGPSPGLNPGRGNYRGFSNNMSSNSGRYGGRGRGRGSHEFVSAQEKPHLFYSKSMVEDPWMFLEPIDFNVPGSSKSWLPKSITMKKPRVREISPRQPNPQFNLAEYLASSYNETVNDAENASEVASFDSEATSLSESKLSRDHL